MRMLRPILLALVVLTGLTGCAENWSYNIKSLHHNEATGRYYAICKSHFSETFVEVDLTRDVFTLLEIDGTCPAPMTVSATPTSR